MTAGRRRILLVRLHLEQQQQQQQQQQKKPRRGDHYQHRLSPLPLWSALRDRWLFDELESRELAAHLDRRCDTVRAYLPMVRDDKMKDALDLVKDMEDMVLSLRLPWLAQSTDLSRKRQVVAMTEAWKNLWGDPKDPAVQEKIAATIRQLESATRENNDGQPLGRFKKKGGETTTTQNKKPPPMSRGGSSSSGGVRKKKRKR